MEKVFIGEVTERETKNALQPINIKTTTGFPKPKDLLPKRSSTNNTSRSPKATNTAIATKIATKPDIENDSVNVDYENENLKRVLSMSQAERDAAVREIQSMLSPSAVSNLLRIAERKNTQLVDIVNKDIKSCVALDVSLDENIYEDSEMPTTEAELESALQRSTNKQKAALEWTGKIEANKVMNMSSNSISTVVEAAAHSSSTSAPDPLSVPFRMKYDRFDLLGCKIAEQSLIASQIESILTSSSFTAFLTDLQRHDIAMMCVELLSSCGCLTAPPTPDSQPQHELHNHQYDQNKPGYTFQEISEVIIYIDL